MMGSLKKVTGKKQVQPLLGTMAFYSQCPVLNASRGLWEFYDNLQCSVVKFTVLQ